MDPWALHLGRLRSAQSPGQALRILERLTIQVRIPGFVASKGGWRGAVQQVRAALAPLGASVCTPAVQREVQLLSNAAQAADGSGAPKDGDVLTPLAATGAGSGAGASAGAGAGAASGPQVSVASPGSVSSSFAVSPPAASQAAVPPHLRHAADARRSSGGGGPVGAGGAPLTAPPSPGAARMAKHVGPHGFTQRNPLRRVLQPHVGISSSRYNPHVPTATAVPLGSTFSNAQTWVRMPATSFLPFGTLLAWLVRAVNAGYARDAPMKQFLTALAVYVGSTALNVLLVVVGARSHEHQCDENLRQWAVVAGATGLLQDVLMAAVLALVLQGHADKRAFLGVFRTGQLLNSFGLVWGIVGAVRVFQSSSSTCDDLLYLTSYWTTVVWLSGLVFLPFLYLAGSKRCFGDSKG